MMNPVAERYPSPLPVREESPTEKRGNKRVQGFFPAGDRGCPPVLSSPSSERRGGSRG